MIINPINATSGAKPFIPALSAQWSGSSSLSGFKTVYYAPKPYESEMDETGDIPILKPAITSSATSTQLYRGGLKGACLLNNVPPGVYTLTLAA